ncbi:replication-associated protein [Chicken circovirus SDWF]|nr:replication-associated protein [Chicken circovirus SDWF]
MTTYNANDNRNTYGFRWTWNNYDKVVGYKQIVESWTKISEWRWLYYGHEICPTSGTPHLQGCIWFKREKSIVQLRKKINEGFPEGIHVDVRSADSVEGCMSYCSKDGKEIVEYGKPPKQGERTDLIAVRDEIMNGRTVDSICIDNPMLYHQYGRTFSKIEDLRMRSLFRKEMTRCKWHYGLTGTGKSHEVYQDFDPKTHYVLNLNDNGYWEGYTQQDIVILNEFRGQIPLGELLDLIDKWPKSVKRRNREPMPFISKWIYITSPYAPGELYKNACRDEDKLDQLLRRVEVIHHSTKF